MKMTKEIEEFINLTITEHMGKAYADWKLSQPSVTEPDEIEEAYKKVIATLSPEQEEVITKYCDQIFNSGAETEEFFYRLLYWLEHCSPLLKWQSFSQMLCGLKKQISQSP